MIHSARHVLQEGRHPYATSLHRHRDPPPHPFARRRNRHGGGHGSARGWRSNGAGVQTNIGEPFGVEVGPDGGLYVTEVRNHRLRRLDLKTSGLTTIAGTGKKGYSGDGGPATKADLNEPYEVRFDREGNLYFVEMKNHVVRKIDAKTGVIQTIAGTGQKDSAAMAARPRRPRSASRIASPSTTRATSTSPTSATTGFAASMPKPARSNRSRATAKSSCRRRTGRREGSRCWVRAHWPWWKHPLGLPAGRE